MNWKFDWIVNVDCVILCLVVYEMVYVEDILVNVFMNEVIELVKWFGDDKVIKFVNGVFFNIKFDIE